MNLGRRALLAAAWAVAALPAIGAPPHDPLATQQALDALFSTRVRPGDGPLAAANPPEGFAGEGASEAQLIAYLDAQRQRGADLNAYRHFGTPLHHAVRAGRIETARWLLRHGADPSLRIEVDGPADADRPDALGVAIRAGTWALLNPLRQHRVFAAQAAAARDAREAAYWRQTLTDATSASALAKQAFPLPRFESAPAVAAALLQHALCSGQTGLALAQLKVEPAARPAPVANARGGCPASGDPANPPSVADWQAIEQRTGWPMLPFAIGHARTPAQGRALLAAGLRSPWGDDTTTAHALRTALQSPSPAAVQPLLRAAPEAALRGALQDAGLRELWLRRIADWPVADMDWALGLVTSVQLAQALPQIFDAWPYAAPGKAAPAERQARWQLLTRRLHAPLAPIAGGGFAYQVPVALWPQWFALGTPMTDADWAEWLRGVQPEVLREAWPALAKHRPTVARRALEWLVAPLSVGPTDDPVARRLSRPDAGGWSPDAQQNARFLDTQGLRVEKPRWLAAGVTGGAEFALGKGWVRQPPAALQKQLRTEPTSCRPPVGPRLRRALAAGEPLGAGTRADAAEPPTQLQPIAWPGAPGGCAWLARSGEPGGGRSFDEDDFFEGPRHFSPCADGNTTLALWDEDTGRWRVIADAPGGDLAAVHAPGLKQSGLVSMEVEMGRCGVGSAGLWRASRGGDGAPQLAPIGPGEPLFDALALQCSLQSVSDCLGLADPAARPDAPLPLGEFVDRHWGRDRTAFLAALDRFDRPALDAERDAGLFADWFDAAAQRFGASTAPLPDKRRRMAWLLAQRTQVAGLSSDTLTALLDWLPPEDWGPIVDAQRCTHPHVLAQLDETARSRGLLSHARRFAAARLRPCPRDADTPSRR